MNSTALIGLIFLLLFIIPVIFFLLTLQNTLKLISPENRKMPPGNVWLILIPLFGMVWQFIVIRKISEAISEECIKLNIDVNEKMPAYTIGLVYCFSSILYLIPILKTIGALVALVSWVTFWIKVYQYKRLLIANKDNYMLDAEREIFHTQA
ncbi:MAG: hypothetical protein ABJA71_17475 [Ginsengibacter sp.]